MNFKVFSDSKQLLEFAAKFIIDERISSLKKDVSSCLEKDCAFPALLYCFSTVDLLGALSTGYARRSSHTEENFKYYLSHFMKCNNFPYNGEPVELLQEIFRHKIVHLAQPKLVVNSKGRDIMWRYEHPNVSNHLKIEQNGHVRQIKNILTPYPIYYDHVFTIGITQLLIDISDSVTRQSDGYIAKLKNNYKGSQRKFDDAIDQIYDPRNK